MKALKSVDGAEVYTRPNGAQFHWRHVGTFFKYGDLSFVVLYAASDPMEHCQGCSLRKLSADDCLKLRRERFGECVSMSRGDGRAVIFHEAGSILVGDDARAANIRAGLGNYL